MSGMYFQLSFFLENNFLSSCHGIVLACWMCRSPPINKTIMAVGVFAKHSQLSFERLVHYHSTKQTPVTVCDDGSDRSTIRVWMKLTISPNTPLDWQQPLVVKMRRPSALTPVTSWESHLSSAWKYTQRLNEIISQFAFPSCVITVCAWLHLETTSLPQNETWANNHSPTSSWWKVKQSFQLVSCLTTSLQTQTKVNDVWINKHLHLVFMKKFNVFFFQTWNVSELKFI